MSDPLHLLAIFLIGVAAGFVDSLVANGGLVSMPLLILSGLPPQVAIATDRLGGIGWSLGAIARFWRGNKIVWKYVPIFTLLSLVAAWVGANLLLSIEPKVLESIIGLLILIALPFLFIRRDFGVRRMEVGKVKQGFGYVVYFPLMLLGGMFGIGTGTLALYLHPYFFGLTMIETSATSAIPWFILSITSLIIFGLHGIVSYASGIALFLGMLVGGYTGAHVAVKKGDRWIKVVFGWTAAALAIKMLVF